PLVALQDERLLFDRAAAAEGILQFFPQVLDVGPFQAELLDDGDFLSAAALALHADDGARRSLFRLFLFWSPFGKVLEPVLQGGERVVELLVRHRRSQATAKKP